MTELRGQEAWSLALMRTHGREDEAVAYLAALNRCRVAFGQEPFDMPEPLSVGLPDLVKCDATKVSDVLGEQLTEVLPDPFGDAFQARAASLRPQPASRFSQSGIAIARKSA